MAVKQEPANTDFKAGLEQVFGDNSKLPLVARKAYAYRSAPPERQAAWQRGLQIAATGKLTDALKAFEQLTSDDANDAAVWYNLGLTKAWLGDNAGAVAALDRCVDLDKDEEQGAQTWRCAEVLLCGHGLEEQANYVEHSATFQIRNPERAGHVLQELQRQHRLIGTQVQQEQGILTGLLVEKVQALTPERVLAAMPRLAAYMLLVGDMLRLWNSNKEMFDAVVRDIQQLGAGVLGDPYIRTGPVHFSDVLADGMAFAVQAASEAESTKRMHEYFETYIEEKWIHKPVRSLGMVPPIDAAGHALLRKKLRGLVQFLADCAATFNSAYDFERLRRKLGLSGGPAPAAATAIAARDIGAMGAAELAGLDIGTLDDGELEAAYQSALKLGAPDLAGKFAKTAVTRKPGADKADRYPMFNHLIQQALLEGDKDAALDFVNEGEKADCEHNEGRRRNDYELRRGQILVKCGEIDKAMDVFDKLIERSPAELRYRGSAAEAMLSAKQGPKALSLAEGGLKKSREQNNRDSEQYFLELTAAAKKV